MRNEEVAKRWSENREGNALNLGTDGDKLYSYLLLIGYTNENGKKIVKDYTSDGNRFVSLTTSRHVGYAKRYADEIEEVS